MTTPDRHPAHSADPDPGQVPGYPERQPRDREEAQRKGPAPKRDPDDGGLDREPEGSADPADD
jgi:hypothetical protein